ncbi:hypothetical protein KY366_02985 [Candidatus Woesearchaeota archaeon]|nr:hypothetical protein [Candidatus Woesearchaeota archaeon]
MYQVTVKRPWKEFIQGLYEKIPEGHSLSPKYIEDVYLKSRIVDGSDMLGTARVKLCKGYATVDSIVDFYPKRKDGKLGRRTGLDCHIEDKAGALEFLEQKLGVSESDIENMQFKPKFDFEY